MLELFMGALIMLTGVVSGAAIYATAKEKKI